MLAREHAGPPVRFETAVPRGTQKCRASDGGLYRIGQRSRGEPQTSALELQESPWGLRDTMTRRFLCDERRCPTPLLFQLTVVDPMVFNPTPVSRGRCGAIVRYLSSLLRCHGGETRYRTWHSLSRAEPVNDFETPGGLSLLTGVL